MLLCYCYVIPQEALLVQKLFRLVFLGLTLAAPYDVVMLLSRYSRRRHCWCRSCSVLSSWASR
jgi:hypothetical protein